MRLVPTELHSPVMTENVGGKASGGVGNECHASCATIANCAARLYLASVLQLPVFLRRANQHVAGGSAAVKKKGRKKTQMVARALMDSFN